MITVLLILVLVIALGLCFAEFILIKNLLKKIDTYEAWIIEFKSDVMDTLANMRSIDTKGTFATGVNDEGKFESDDEVGVVFKQLLELIEKLNSRTQ